MDGGTVPAVADYLEGQTIEVTEVLGRWTEPDARFFRVRGDDGRTYVLRLDERRHR